MTCQHDRCGNLNISCFLMDFSPVIKKSILQNHSLRKEERESRTFVAHHEQTKLFTKLSVVTFLRLFHTGNIFFQICFLCERSSVDSGKHFILLASSPVSTCNTGKLECFYRFGCHKVRSCTKVNKLTLLIKADLSIFWKIFDKLHFIWLIFLFEECDRFFSGFGKTGNRKCFLYHFLHLNFDLCKILCSDRVLAVNIIIKSVCNRWSDCKLYIRVQSLDCLCHNVGCGVTESAFSTLILKCQDA